MAFVIYPATVAGGDGMATIDAAVVTTQNSTDVVVERNGGKTHGRGRGGVSDEKDVAATPVWREIDFDNVVNYRLEKSSNGKHIAHTYVIICVRGSRAQSGEEEGGTNIVSIIIIIIIICSIMKLKNV